MRPKETFDPQKGWVSEEAILKSLEELAKTGKISKEERSRLDQLKEAKNNLDKWVEDKPKISEIKEPGQYL